MFILFIRYTFLIVFCILFNLKKLVFARLFFTGARTYYYNVFFFLKKRGRGVNLNYYLQSIFAIIIKNIYKYQYKKRLKCILINKKKCKCEIRIIIRNSIMIIK